MGNIKTGVPGWCGFAASNIDLAQPGVIRVLDRDREAK
jgi:hypothetical protein